ncbi:MAG: NUDIX hydrolase [Acidimicrobiales bacterium]
MIEAAGGVVWRRDDAGQVEVLLIHRPVRDDWSFPKGKLDRGEDHLTAALREVEEETGLRCRALDELPETRYTDRFGRPKRVRYWSMQVETDPGFVPNDEVDDYRWLAQKDAHLRLSYDPDRLVLAALRP